MRNEPRYELRIQIAIEDREDHGRIRVEERLEIDAAGFLEVASVLQRFHELAQTLKGEEEVGR